MSRLISITHIDDIPPAYQDTHIQTLFAYHNLNRPFDDYVQAPLLIGMCMDHRKQLHIPANFAYVIRTGGANLRYNEFQVSYALAVGGVDSIALIGHNNCGMVNLIARKEQFVSGLIEKAGWQRDLAEDHFQHFAPLFEIGNEVDFVKNEAERLRMRYPGVLVAPMLYQLEDNLLYLIEEDHRLL